MCLKNIYLFLRYCHECMNKATGERNCLVCGKRVGKNLVLCELCPRAYHTDCHNPVMPKVTEFIIYLIYLNMDSDGYTYEWLILIRCPEGSGTAQTVTVNNQRREIAAEGVIREKKEESLEIVKVPIIHQLGDYVKAKQMCRLVGPTCFIYKVYHCELQDKI